MTTPEDRDAPYTLPTTYEELNTLQGIHYEMPPELGAFYERYARAQVRYAATVLGEKNAALTVVRRLYHHLALNWRFVLRQDGGPEAYAWQALKTGVELHMRMMLRPTIDGRSIAPAGNERTVAVHAAARATLETMRNRLANLDSPLGLYEAIVELPERQFDAIILHYVLGYSPQQAADIIGIHPGTVRHHRRLARKRIATKLGIDLGDDEEKE